MMFRIALHCSGFIAELACPSCAAGVDLVSVVPAGVGLAEALASVMLASGRYNF